MKTLFRLVLLLCIVAAVAAGTVIVLHVKKTDAEKIKMETKDSATAAKSAVTDAARAGTTAATEVATNMEARLKAGEVQAGEVATNIVGKVTTETTNVVDKAKQKFENFTH